MLIITRVLLGRAYAHPSPPFGALAPPLLPNAPNNERYVDQDAMSSSPVSQFDGTHVWLSCRFDSVIATPQGTFHEVIMFDNAQIYPELVVYYTA